MTTTPKIKSSTTWSPKKSLSTMIHTTTTKMDMTLFTSPDDMNLHHQVNGQPSTTGNWAATLLRECAAAISAKDSARIHHLLWMLNELASPYGDSDQKLAAHFLQALFCKATASGRRCLRTLTAVAEHAHSFDAARRLILRFQELSPWTTFGHVAANGAILEALDGEPKIHVVDMSDTLCTQWPTLLEALATRSDDTPSLRLTVVVTRASLARGVMKEVGHRMEKFARLMGVPFEFRVVSGVAHLGELTREGLGVEEGDAIVVNCMGALRRVGVEERDGVVRFLKSLNPKIVTIVEEEADFSSSSTRVDFVKTFEECLRFYTLYFDMLEGSFPPTSNERLVLERECSRSIVRVLACDDDNEETDEQQQQQQQHDAVYGECERRERGTQWSERLKETFSPFGFSDDVIDDVKALLKRYRTGWGLVVPPQDQQQQRQQYGAYLTWKDEHVVWASAWKP